MAGGTSGGVITGHGRLRVRMEEAQLSAGTHQRPNQALAAGRRGRAANEKGVPASCSDKAFLNPSHSCHPDVFNIVRGDRWLQIPGDPVFRGSSDLA